MGMPQVFFRQARVSSPFPESEFEAACYSTGVVGDLLGPGGTQDIESGPIPQKRGKERLTTAPASAAARLRSNRVAV
jgi:hypothetical protein